MILTADLHLFPVPVNIFQAFVDFFANYSSRKPKIGHFARYKVFLHAMSGRRPEKQGGNRISLSLTIRWDGKDDDKFQTFWGNFRVAGMIINK